MIWQQARHSYWFMPSLMLVGSTLLSALTLALDRATVREVASDIVPEELDRRVLGQSAEAVLLACPGPRDLLEFAQRPLTPLRLLPEGGATRPWHSALASLPLGMFWSVRLQGERIW